MDKKTQGLEKCKHGLTKINCSLCMEPIRVKRCQYCDNDEWNSFPDYFRCRCCGYKMWKG